MNIETIWKEYRADIKAFLHSKVANYDDVDDLLQDILLKAYKNIDNIKSESCIKPWLFQIANHMIIDFYRKKGKPREWHVGDIYWHEESIGAIQTLSFCVFPFMKALPKEIAELLIAIDIHGQSQKEYASNLGINYSTVKSRVQKARRQLRKLFEDCCYLSFDQYGSLIDFDPKSKDCEKC